jgi:hypothetical protein
MKELFLELISIYKTKVRVKQLKRKTIENFSRFFISFIDSNKNPKDKKDKYLQLKKSGLNYILDNQDFIYSQISK